MKHPIYLAALAAGLSLLAASTASSAVLYFAGPAIPIPTTVDGVSINLETGASANTNDLAGAHVNFTWGGAVVGNDADSSATVPIFQPVRTGTGIFDTIDNLAAGTAVDASSTFATGYGGSGDPNAHLGTTFTVGTSGYIGFSIETAGGTNYGWMRVTLQPNVAGGFVHEWAYELTPGQALEVGSVIPEPSTGLLALLAAGGVLFRRKRA